MTSRMKKMFHRKKDENFEEPTQRHRAPAAAKSNPAIRTSLYESTTAGGLPQSGDYPIKGNDSSVVLQTGRKSSVRSLRSRRSSSRGSQSAAPLRAPTPTQYDGARSNPRFPPQTANASGIRSYDSYQNSTSPTHGRDDRSKRWSRTSVPQDLANLSIGDSQSPTTVTQTVTTTQTGHRGQFGNNVPSQIQTQANPNQNHPTKVRTPHASPYPQDPFVNRIQGKNESYGTRGNGNPEAVDRLDGQRPSAYRSQQGHLPSTNIVDAQSTPGDYGEYGAGLARQKSIPRKQIGTTAQAPHSNSMPSNTSAMQNSHSRQQSTSKALPSTPNSNYGLGVRVSERNPEPSSILDRSRPVTRGTAEPRNPQDVVNRAKTNTYDTEVIERVAPAVVHENVTKDIHYVREEAITREIHTHDVYHRMLPVIDVEVLPPRHFLPVKGGGLVEVSAAEVPGRGNNWVIAETASKIPSDQAAPGGSSRFTARQFPGKEGDAVRYTTSEGHEKTEQTWVHPPELEQGARLTGQSWPMVFGDDTTQREPLDHSTPKSAKRKSPKKGPATQANPAQRADRLGRSA